ncbi:MULTISPECIES: alpha/beta fold hydrolase [Mumia]|uniref:alpha/beta fold hydrolase n=1 Tax=Mumia TaxID=1546255 RepID=UPI0014226E97|nr:MULTISPECIES: alpha/beta hydrolase [unclassified Mumia]QMW65722.1 alpha/beta hydrolase [Mumia sp. ZJ1417]
MDWRRLGTYAAVTAGTLAAAGATAAAARVATDRRRARRRARRGDAMEFGTLHAPEVTVMATDGVPLHVEIEEPADPAAYAAEGAPTIVFAHGWVLDLDCWHYQRAALRGRARMVFYDQREHGSSGDATLETCTLDQLGDDLKSVVDAVAPTGPLVLVGHSMGAMTVMSFAAQYGDLVRDRVVGVVLMGTSAGDLIHPTLPLARLQPWLPRFGPLLDQARRLDSFPVMRMFAVGPDSPAKYADMTDEMIARSRSKALWDFAGNFVDLDLYGALPVLPGKRTVVMGGTKDKLTPMRHSRRLAELIDGSELLVLEGAGHMMMLERHEDVTAAIESLWESA